MLMLKSEIPKDPAEVGIPGHRGSSTCLVQVCQEQGRALRWQRLGNNNEEKSSVSMSMARGGLCDVCFSLMLLRFLISFPEPEGSDAGDFWQFLSRLLYSAGFRLAFPLPPPLLPS